MRWRAIQPAVFGVIALSFVLPFAQVSCSTNPDPESNPESRDKSDLAGYELVIGAQLEERFENTLEEFAVEEEQARLGADPFAVLAFGAALAGIGCAFLARERQRAVASLTVAGAGTLATIVLGLAPALRAYGTIRVVWKAGYWACLALFLAATAISYLAYRDARPPPYRRE